MAAVAQQAGYEYIDRPVYYSDEFVVLCTKFDYSPQSSTRDCHTPDWSYTEHRSYFSAGSMLTESGYDSYGHTWFVTCYRNYLRQFANCTGG